MARQRCGHAPGLERRARRHGSVGTGSATPSCRLFSCSQSCSPCGPRRNAAARRGEPRLWHRLLDDGARVHLRVISGSVRSCHRPARRSPLLRRGHAVCGLVVRAPCRRVDVPAGGGVQLPRLASCGRGSRPGGGVLVRRLTARNTRSARERVGGVRSHGDSPGPVSAVPPVRSAQRCGRRRGWLRARRSNSC